MTMFVKTANGGPLNMRSSPSTSSSILAQIKNGTQVEAEKFDDNWSSVSYNNKEGYVMTKYLSSATSSSISKENLQRIYNSLKETLNLIDEVLT